MISLSTPLFSLVNTFKLRVLLLWAGEKKIKSQTARKIDLHATTSPPLPLCL
jgi:hypothetical protein